MTNEDRKQWRRDRLSELADKMGGRTALGVRLGYKNGAFIGQLISGHRPITEKTIEAIHEIQGFRGWFDPDVDLAGMQVESTTEDRDLVHIPQYEAGGAMGKSLVLQGDQPGIIRLMAVTREWAQKNLKAHTGLHNLCIVTGFGDSMKPMYNPGDPLILDQGVKTCEIDAVYFFRVDGFGFIKRLQIIPGEGIRVISENKKYEPWTIKHDADFEVFGRVMKAWCSEDL